MQISFASMLPVVALAFVLSVDASKEADFHSSRGLEELSDFSCVAGDALNNPNSYNFGENHTSIKFFGATTTSNGLVVLAPYAADCVGTFNPTTNVFVCVDISSTIDVGHKFHGATTAKNGLVVFAPFAANCVGVFDPSTSVFNCVDIPSTICTASNSIHSLQFTHPTTASNGLIVFTPYNADCVGTFDPTTSTFRCVDISTTIEGDHKFNGATTTHNGLVVFAPDFANCVGIFDPTTDVFECVDIPRSTAMNGKHKFSGAITASNGLIIFSPKAANCVGTFSPSTNVFSCVAISSTLDFDYKFSGATTTSDGLVVFSPLTNNCIGMLKMHSAAGCAAPKAGAGGLGWSRTPIPNSA